MGLSALNFQRKEYNFITEDLCPMCHTDKETVTHFSLEYPVYVALRLEMLQNVQVITQDHTSNKTSDMFDCIHRIASGDTMYYAGVRRCHQCVEIFPLPL